MIKVSKITSATPTGDQTSSVQEIETLKSEVALIASRVAGIDGSIGGLKKLIGNLLTSGQLQEVDDNVEHKKRRLTEYADVRSSSSSSSYQYQQISQHGSQFFESTAESTVPANNPDPFSSTPNLIDPEYVNSVDDLSIDFEDFLESSERSSPRTSSRRASPQMASNTASLFEQIDSTNNNSAGNQTSSVKYVPDIVQYLSLDMQERFVDKLAVSVGSHFATLLAASVIPPKISEVALPPQPPAISMNNYSQNFLQEFSHSSIKSSKSNPHASAALCSLIAVHCSNGNGDSATCIALTAASVASGITCINGVCTFNANS
jgi:hypothetical protein